MVFIAVRFFFLIVFSHGTESYYFIFIVTWDIRRRDSCVDYFPNQDYETECKLDLENYSDKTTLTPPIDKKV